jgi:uncharacterized membrane protein
MNGAHVHLIVNHLPIVGIIIGTLVMLTGLILKKEQIKQTALGINLFSALSAILAHFSGEEAEEVIEDMKGVSETLIHIHEEYAEVFFILALILGLISLLTLYFSIKRKSFAKYGMLAALGLSIALIIVGKQVGTSGGEIRHSEIRTQNTTTVLEDGNSVIHLADD